MRSIDVADAPLIREFVRSLSFETWYLRFMSGVKEFGAPIRLPDASRSSF